MYLCMCAHFSLNSVVLFLHLSVQSVYISFFIFSLALSTVYHPLQLQTSVSVQSNTRSSAVTSADTKFLLIPLAFMLLRIGSIVVVIVFIYAEANPREAVSYFLLCVAVS